MFTSNVYSNRRKSLIDSIQSGLVLLPGHTESPMNYAGNSYRFRQNSSFLYFVGIDLPDLFAVIDLDNHQTVLFGDELTIDDIVWTGPLESIKERALKSGILHTKPLSDLSNFMHTAIKKKRAIHFLPQSRVENRLQLSSLLHIDIDSIQTHTSETLIRAVVDLRSIKGEEELLELQKAAEIGYEMHLSAMKLALPGNAERHIAGLIEGIALSKGQGISFPIILSQKGEILHGHDHSRILKTGKLLLCDAGAESLGHYASDYTRTTPVGGRFSTLQRSIYQMVVDANQYAIEQIQPGIAYREIHLGACRVLANGLKSMGVLKGDVDEAVSQGAHALFMPHGLGHMLGLDVHDMEDLGEQFVGYDQEIARSTQFGLSNLRLGKRLKPGFVLTVEPGLYFMPELIQKWESEHHLSSFINYEKAKELIGFGGIRLEDNVVVTDRGCKIIGKRLPITIQEVEALF